MSEELKRELLTYNNLEDRTFILVKELFKDKKDKGGDDYLNHLLRVRDNFDDSFSRTIALLHDVVEDTSVCFDDLKELGYTKNYLEILSLLTHERSVSYHDYVSRIIESKNEVALLVKIADMKDNMSEVRLRVLDKDVQEHLKNKYCPEMIRLEKAKGEMTLC